MTEAELKAIEERAEKATPGPWLDVDACWCGSIHLDGVPEPKDHEDPRSATHSDLSFMSHARSDVPALVAALRQAQARIGELERGYAQLQNRGSIPLE